MAEVMSEAPLARGYFIPTSPRAAVWWTSVAAEGTCSRTLYADGGSGSTSIPKQHEHLHLNGLECYQDLRLVPRAVADVVISNHALEHVPYPIEALREVRRILKPGGLVAIVVPIDDWRTQRKDDPRDINHHLYTWTPHLLGKCLREVGFDPQSMLLRVLTHAWFPGWSRAYAVLPASVFDLLCRLFAIIKRRRSLMAIARNPATAET